jgi:chemotaxis signal transduction protein
MDFSQLAEVIPGIIIFRISTFEFCINVRDVYVIKRIEEFEELKYNGSYDKTYVSLYNINIPIIDMSKNLQLPVKSNGSSTMILIIKHHCAEDDLEKTFGILVDEVIELITTGKNDDDYLLKFVPSGDNPFLSGSIFIGNRKILLPDFSKIAAELFINNRFN